MELNLAISVKDNKKCFYKPINSKRGRELLHVLLAMKMNVVNNGKGRFFASVFSSKTSYPQDIWPPELVGTGSRTDLL